MTHVPEIFRQEDDGTETPMALVEKDAVGFGGGDEDGLLCGCGRRVRTPFCPWCGKRLDDAGAQLLAYLLKAVEQNKRAAEAKERLAQGASNGDSDRSAENEKHYQRTAKRLLDRAAQQNQWAAWVRKHLDEENGQ